MSSVRERGSGEQDRPWHQGGPRADAYGQPGPQDDLRPVRGDAQHQYEGTCADNSLGYEQLFKKYVSVTRNCKKKKLYISGKYASY